MTSLALPKIQTLKIQTQTQNTCKPTPAKPRDTLIPSAIPSTNRPSASDVTAPIDNTKAHDQPPARNTSGTPTPVTRPATRSMIALSPAGRRTQSQSCGKNSNYMVEVDECQLVYDIAIVSDPNEPKNIQEALRSEEHEQWRK